MSHKGGEKFQIESLRLRMSINEHMASVGEEISCVLEEQQRDDDDVCNVKLNVRVFVMERLSTAAKFMFSLFQREMETLETLLERRDKLLDVILQPHVKLHGAGETTGAPQRPNTSGGGGQVAETEVPVHHTGQHHWTLGSNQDGGDGPRVRGRRRLPGGTDEQPETERAEHHQLQPGGGPPAQPGVPHLRQQAKQPHHGDFLHLPVCQEVSPEQQEMSPSLVQEEPEPPHIKVEQEELLQRPEEADGSTLTLLAVKSEGDDENQDTEPVAGTSTQHMQTQAYVEDCGTSQHTSDNLLSSHRSAGRKTHRVTHTGKKPITCIVCGKRFTQRSSSSLKSHMMTHSGEKPFTCTVCGKGCTQRGQLKSHMLTHTRVKPFNCTVCGKGFVNTRKLKSHMMTHTEEFSITCTVCGRGFSQFSNLKMHMWRKHTNIHTAQKPFKCTVCSKGYAQRKSFNQHMMTHTVEKPHTEEKLFICTVCGKGCFDLKSHMMTHTGEWPFTCTVCGKGCVNTANLKSHMMTHTGDWPFKCTVCDKGYVNPANLKSHMMTHTGEWPFKCTVCGNGFSHMAKIKMHMMIHTGEKPFMCTVCSKGFAQKNNLKTHMRRMHAGEKPFTVCGDN